MFKHNQIQSIIPESGIISVVTKNGNEFVGKARIEHQDAQGNIIPEPAVLGRSLVILTAPHTFLPIPIPQESGIGISNQLIPVSAVNSGFDMHFLPDDFAAVQLVSADLEGFLTQITSPIDLPPKQQIIT